jgi:hypothetical protein
MRWYKRRHGGQRPSDLIAAHEIACYAYCPEQWRLQYGLGLQAENQAALEAGTRHHADKAVVEQVAGWSICLGLAILVTALLLLALRMIFR